MEQSESAVKREFGIRWVGRGHGLSAKSGALGGGAEGVAVDWNRWLWRPVARCGVDWKERMRRDKFYGRCPKASFANSGSLLLKSCG